MKRIFPAVACLLLLSGCAGLSDWIQGFVGGEGKIAEPVSASVLDQPPPSEITPETAVKPPFLLNKEQVKAIQADLVELGYRPGPVDGFFGPLTEEAVRAYQQDVGLVPDGLITRELVAMLEMAPRPERERSSDVPSGKADTPLPEVASEDPDAAVAESVPANEAGDNLAVEQSLAPADEAQGDPTVAQSPVSVDGSDEQIAKGSPEIPDGGETDMTPPEPEQAETSAAHEEPADVVHVENSALPPLYDVGDTFIWSNGRIETVARVVGDKLFWQVDNGMGYAADRNFLIPPASWTGPAGSGETEVPPDIMRSWPLKPHTSLEFQVSENGLSEDWNCSVADIERIKVPAGTFDSVVLACTRDRAPPGEWVRRVWHYAPAARHYVARNDYLPDGTRISKELLGIRPGTEDWPPALRAGLNRAIGSALDNLPAGETSRWSSTGIEKDFEIRPGPIRQGDGDTRCRNYKLVATGGDVARIYPALACQRGNGAEWRIPGIAGDTSSDLSFAAQSR